MFVRPEPAACSSSSAHCKHGIPTHEAAHPTQRASGRCAFAYVTLLTPILALLRVQCSGCWTPRASCGRRECAAQGACWTDGRTRPWPLHMAQARPERWTRLLDIVYAAHAYSASSSLELACPRLHLCLGGGFSSVGEASLSWDAYSHGQRYSIGMESALACFTHWMPCQWWGR